MVTLMKSLLVSALVAGFVLVAPAAHAVELTPAQLTAIGFPKKPNTVGWGGTARISQHRAPQWQDVIITGRAADFTQPGQVLTMQRFMADNASGDGTFRDLAITTTVQADRTFVLHFQIGMPGAHGYRVGYSTTGPSPEFVGFQFQFTTTGSGAPAPNADQPDPVTLTPRQLARAGFTRTPNITGWGGTARMNTSTVQVGQPVRITGTASAVTKPGQTLQLNRFVATDRRGSGHFEPTGLTTTVRKDGTFRFTFRPQSTGTVGYTLGYPTQSEWIGIEFQVTAN
jgi:hypothetical protein